MLRLEAPNIMWRVLTRIILRFRLINLIIIGLITLFMGWQALRVQMSYEMARMLPSTDSASIDYESFKSSFGQDGAVMFVGFEGENIYELSRFQAFYDLSEEIRQTEGVEEVVSLTRLYHLSKDTVAHKFVFRKVLDYRPEKQSLVDSIQQQILRLPFYDGLLFNSKTGVHLMAITLDKQMLNSKARVALIYSLHDKIDAFANAHRQTAHYSGLPYIRTITTKKIQDELLIFTLASLLVAALLLFFFFRSKKAVVFPLIIVIISVIWALGTISLLGFKITILTGILPPLLIIIGVENCIFLLNKFHSEYKEHGNKVKALSRVIERIGKANVLTNATTAAGFAAFMVTGNSMLTEFGLVASVNILIIFFLSLFLIPIVYSYLPGPNPKHLAHLESGFTGRIILKILPLIQNHRRWVYASVIILVIIAVFGISRLTASGKIVDDIPQNDPLYTDLMFLEKHFKGVMPLEISIDTRKPRGVLKMSTLNRIDRLQEVLKDYPELSRPLSVAEVVKFSKQAFFFGDPAKYSLPGNHEKNFIMAYMPRETGTKRTVLNSFIDTSYSRTRISVQMANIGTFDIQRIQNEIRPRIDSIFPPEDFSVKVTGTSVVFLKGTQYLVKNLLQSLLLAMIIITLLMALLFTSWRMILISLIPNLLPQILTAALMGFLDIPIKPSTILIFSIALGISVDNTIHYLSRYRMFIRYHQWDIRTCVQKALSETGYSMIYSSSILFFGFSIFIFSSFGGTEAMGYLISFTLLVALLSNLLLLPSLLMWLDKLVTTKAFEEPLLDVFDEEDEINLNKLEIEK